MTVNSPKILALDFDGVICDGLIEYFEVAWRTYCQVWQVENQIPSSDTASKFYQLRPVIETGWEMPVLVKALVEQIPEQQILLHWPDITKEILQKDNLVGKEIGVKLDKLRDDWIATDLNSWLNLHKFYTGVIDKIQATITSTVDLYVVTTKEGRFTQQLLEQQGLNLPAETIIGKEVKRPKYEILREFIQKADITPDNLWFVEDRLKTLQLVQQQKDLEQVKLFLADWGYNTPAEKTTAKNDPQIKLLSLTEFTGEFSNWLTPDAQ